MTVGSVEFVRIYNQLSLKELSARVVKHNFVSNVNAVFESEFVEKLSPSELSYLTHPKRAKLLTTVLYAMSVNSSTSPATFAPISSKILGELNDKE